MLSPDQGEQVRHKKKADTLRTTDKPCGWMYTRAFRPSTKRMLVRPVSYHVGLNLRAFEGAVTVPRLDRQLEASREDGRNIGNSVSADGTGYTIPSSGPRSSSPYPASYVLK